LADLTLKGSASVSCTTADILQPQTDFSVQNAELALLCERRARVAAEKRLEELMSLGGGKLRIWGRSFSCTVDVYTQTDSAGTEYEYAADALGELWHGDVFDGEQMCDEDLNSAIMLQRAATATHVLEERKSAEAVASSRHVADVQLLESPR
jgi:hypothetical protein